jgi:hypothetical protein
VSQSLEIDPALLPAALVDEYVDDRQLAQRTPIARATWQAWRVRKEGPPYARVGRRVLYFWPAVCRWLVTRGAR